MPLSGGRVYMLSCAGFGWPPCANCELRMEAGKVWPGNCNSLSLRPRLKVEHGMPVACPALHAAIAALVAPDWEDEN